VKADDTKPTVNREALKVLAEIGKVWVTAADDGLKLGRTTWDEMWPGRRVTEVDRINARLDALASKERPRDPVIADQVDELILDTRLELVQESLDRAEQAAWERRMDINAVLDPVPVRVDARMRPLTS
jgi:hypothetical protein